MSLSQKIHKLWYIQRLKRLPAVWETQIRSLGGEDPLEKEMATHSSILAWRIPWREEPGRLQSMGSQRVGHNWATFLSLSWPSNPTTGHTHWGNQNWKRHVYPNVYCCCCCYVTSVMSNSVRSRRRQTTRLPRPWNSPGKNTGVGSHSLLQDIFPTQIFCIAGGFIAVWATREALFQNDLTAIVLHLWTVLF